MKARDITAASIALVIGVTMLGASIVHNVQEDYRPDTELPRGPETVMVYIGDSSCGACGSPEHKAEVRQLKLMLSERAAEREEEFAAIGVAMDWDVQAGWQFLKEYGSFDEISLGRNWAGTLVQRYVWREFPGKPAIPQIVILRREGSVDERGVLLSDERLVRRLLGTKEISTFLSTMKESKGADQD